MTHRPILCFVLAMTTGTDNNATQPVEVSSQSSIHLYWADPQASSGQVEQPSQSTVVEFL